MLFILHGKLCIKKQKKAKQNKQRSQKAERKKQKIVCHFFSPKHQEYVLKLPLYCLSEDSSDYITFN